MQHVSKIIPDITLEHPLGRLFECSFVVWPNTWELKKKTGKTFRLRNAAAKKFIQPTFS